MRNAFSQELSGGFVGSISAAQGLHGPRAMIYKLPRIDNSPEPRGEQQMKPYGFRGVERIAKVSVGTVDPSINGRGACRQSTCERVIAIAKEHVYVPNSQPGSCHSLNPSFRSEGVFT
jgi:hypothetical protein